MLVARNTDNNDIWVEEDANAAAVIAAERSSIIYYRIEPQGDGNFLLRRLRVKPGTVATVPKVVTAELEDDV